MNNEITKGDAEILEVVGRGITYYKDIAKELTRTNGTILRALSNMKKVHLIISAGKGQYHLPRKIVEIKETEFVPLPGGEYSDSTKYALHLLVKVRRTIDKLMDGYDQRVLPFPASEIKTLAILEKAYKEEMSKTEIIVENKNKRYNHPVLIIPNNNRGDLTPEQCADYNESLKTDLAN